MSRVYKPYYSRKVRNELDMVRYHKTVWNRQFLPAMMQEYLAGIHNKRVRIRYPNKFFIATLNRNSCYPFTRTIKVDDF